MGVIIGGKKIDFQKNNYILETETSYTGFSKTLKSGSLTRNGYADDLPTQIVGRIKLSELRTVDDLMSFDYQPLPSTINANLFSMVDGYFFLYSLPMVDGYTGSGDTIKPFSKAVSVSFSVDSEYLYITFNINYSAEVYRAVAKDNSGNSAEIGFKTRWVHGFFGYVLYNNKYLITTNTGYVGVWQTDTSFYSTTPSVNGEINNFPVREGISTTKLTQTPIVSGDELSYKASGGVYAGYLVYEFMFPNIASGNSIKGYAFGANEFDLYITESQIRREIISG